MELEFCLQQLTNDAERIETLVEGVSLEAARWKPAPDAWSILEVINHLADEEREDFKVRLDIILHRPEERWPRIDPGGWVSKRRYNERPLDESLRSFLDERQKSLSWLQTLAGTDWTSDCRAPWGGRITAGDMLAAWVTHDLLHMRQLVELHYAIVTQAVSPHSGEYAGDW